MQLLDFLQDGRLRLTVRACPESLDRTVRWVHTVEILDPFPILEGEELVLTDGCWHRRPSDSAEFVRALTENGVTGVAFGLATVDATTPPDLIEACVGAGLALFEVPFDVPFLWISEAFVANVARERETQLTRAIQRSEAMVTAVRNGDGVTGVLDVLANDYPLEPWLLSATGRILAVTQHSPSGVEVGAVAAAAASVGRLPETVSRPNGKDFSIFPIMALNEPNSHDALLVCRGALRSLATHERSAIDQALAYLAIELPRLDAMRSIRGRFACGSRGAGRRRRGAAGRDARETQDLQPGPR